MIVIPKVFADEVKIGEWQRVRVFADWDRIVIEPVRDAAWLALHGRRIGRITPEEVEEESLREQGEVTGYCLTPHFFCRSSASRRRRGSWRPSGGWGAHELYYSDVSLLEALWRIVKVIGGSEEELSRIEEGVTAIRGTMKQAPTTGEAVRAAIRMYRLGHGDLIDDLLFSMAASGGLRLLTVDEELVRFVEDHGLPRGHVKTPEEL